MTYAELQPHKAAIQRQAICFFNMPNVFAGEPRMQRWKNCVRMIAETWVALGPQNDGFSGPTIYLSNSVINKPGSD